MEFTLNEEQAAIVEMVRDFAESEIAPFALDWDRDKHFPVDVLRKGGELGLGGICVSDELGGAGLSRLDAVLIFEALARACPTISSYISIHNMCAWMIDRFGAAELRQQWLPDLVGMQKLASYCLTEPGAGSDAAALKTRASREGDHYVLNGQKQFISGAGAADLYLVMARTGGAGPKGVSALLVPSDVPGLSFGANERKMGWNAQPTRAVMFENVRIPATFRLGEEGQGFAIAMAGLDGGRLNIAAASLGGAQSAFEKALAYVQERHAFEQPLAGFQAVQFRLADMQIDLEASRTFLWRAATLLDRGDPQATMFCAMAKRLVTDRCYAVADQALQLHGGYGYLADFGIEKIVRDLRVHQILEGTNEIMRVIVSRNLLSRQVSASA